MPKQRKSPDKLNHNETLFCSRYVQMEQNGTRAYQSVWSRSGEAAAAVGASRLLRKPKVLTEIRKLSDAAIKAEHMTAAEVIREISRIANQDIVELTDLNGRIRRLRDIPLKLRRCIKSVKRNRDGTFEFSFWSKDVQLTNLGKFHKLLTERVEFHDKTPLGEKLDKIRLRLEKRNGENK